MGNAVLSALFKTEFFAACKLPILSKVNLSRIIPRWEIAIKLPKLKLAGYVDGCLEGQSGIPIKKLKIFLD